MQDSRSVILDQRSAISDSEPVPTALLRAPAGLAAGAFLIGLVAGAFAAPLAAVPASAVTYLVTLLVCAPFLLPTSWYRRHRALWIWMAAAAAMATVRAVFMAGFLLPYQPPGLWILKAGMDLLAAAVLWIATIAVRRSLIADR